MHRQWVGKTGAVSACVLYQQYNYTIERKREENKEKGIEESLDENNGLFNRAQILLMPSAYRFLLEHHASIYPLILSLLNFGADY